MPRSVMVAHAGLPGAFDSMTPQISSRGTYNHQDMPFGHTSRDAGMRSSLIASMSSSRIPLTVPLLYLLVSYMLQPILCLTSGASSPSSKATICHVRSSLV